MNAKVKTESGPPQCPRCFSELEKRREVLYCHQCKKEILFRQAVFGGRVTTIPSENETLVL